MGLGKGRSYSANQFQASAKFPGKGGLPGIVLQSCFPCGNGNRILLSQSN